MKKTNADFKKTGVSNGRKIAMKIIAVAVSVLCLLGTLLYLQNADKAAQDTVKIARLKRAVPANSMITKDDIEGYDLIKKEYDANNMILFDNVDKVYDKYSAYYLRESTILYQDQITDEKPIRNEWLYSLSEGEEVVTISYNYLEAGGDILLPGDTIRIRVSYEADSAPTSEADDEGNPNESYYRRTEKTVKTDILFNAIVVKDMINASGHSVYEVYKEVMRLDEKQRQEVMKSSSFLSNIKPRALLLSGTPEDMERYAYYSSSFGGGSFLITILSRADNIIGLDSLPTLETEVRSWIDGGSAGR